MTRQTKMKSQLQEICKNYHVEIMYAFGSRSREIKGVIEGEKTVRNTVSSDADIGIKAFKGSYLSVRQKARLMAELEDLFGVSRVDLVILAEADSFLAANVIRGERLHCEDDYTADEYELYVLRRAGDLAPLETERLRFIFGESS